MLEPHGDLAHHTLDVGGLANTLVGEMVPVGTTEPQVVANPERKRGGASTEERTMRAWKSPLLSAFNKYAHELREELRALGTMSGAEVEKEIGDRWKSMNEVEKKQKIEDAREEQAKLLANCPLDANGQPIISEALLGRPGKKRKKGKQSLYGDNKLKVFRDMTGIKFDAVVDGEFDVGYFFTARAKEPGFGVLRGIFFKQHTKLASMMAPPEGEGAAGAPSTAIQVLDQTMGPTPTAEEVMTGDAGIPELTVSSGMVSGLDVNVT